MRMQECSEVRADGLTYDLPGLVFYVAQVSECEVEITGLPDGKITVFLHRIVPPIQIRPDFMLEFWLDYSNGYLRLGVRTMPWIDIPAYEGQLNHDELVLKRAGRSIGCADHAPVRFSRTSERGSGLRTDRQEIRSEDPALRDPPIPPSWEYGQPEPSMRLQDNRDGHHWSHRDAAPPKEMTQAELFELLGVTPAQLKRAPKVPEPDRDSSSGGALEKSKPDPASSEDASEKPKAPPKKRATKKSVVRKKDTTKKAASPKDAAKKPSKKPTVTPSKSAPTKSKPKASPKSKKAGGGKKPKSKS